ncbi:TPA: hypothetical protein ACH3X3_012707 [Trebouxia sp. C0006]
MRHNIGRPVMERHETFHSQLRSILKMPSRSYYSLIFSEATGAGIMTIFKDTNELEQYLRGLNPKYDQYTKDLWTNGVTSTSQLGNASPATLIACGVKSVLHAEDIIAQSQATGQEQEVGSFWAKPYRQKLQALPPPSRFGTMWNLAQSTS